MLWPLSIFEKQTEKDDYPVSKTIQRAADVIGMEVNPMTNGFLAQARVIEELANRIVDLEAKLERQTKTSSM
jgi:hypothetical protein